MRSPPGQCTLPYGNTRHACYTCYMPHIKYLGAEAGIAALKSKYEQTNTSQVGCPSCALQILRFPFRHFFPLNLTLSDRKGTLNSTPNLTKRLCTVSLGEYERLGRSWKLTTSIWMNWNKTCAAPILLDSKIWSKFITVKGDVSECRSWGADSDLCKGLQTRTTT